ncbi:MAG TPA: hypothetical protein VK487_11205 [Candidatus Bathyarchaeia archaeon]|nr:hypothetical protein [Candidatus Bathyarchaeia archaeon]
MKGKEPTIIDEPYTCTSCGRKNLKFNEIVFKEDENGQVTEVLCGMCGLIAL